MRQGYESSCCSDEEDEEEDEVLALAKGVLRHKRVQRIHSGTQSYMPYMFSSLSRGRGGGAFD